MFFERAIDVWTDLRERFSQGDLLCVTELQEEIYSLKQEELDNYRTLTPCSCSARTYPSQDFIICFLKGLDDQFAMVRSQILLLDPLPSTTRVFSMIIQHERPQHHPSSSMETNPFINVISGKGRTKPTRKCEFCGRLGHTIDSCFQKNNINLTKCTHCDRVGHSSDVCYTKFGYPPGHPKYPGKPCPFNNRNTFGSNRAIAGGNVNNVTASSSSDVAPTLIHEGERKDVSTLGQGLHITTTQFQQLMSLLNKASGSGRGNSEIPSRANLSHSNPNQSHNSSLGSRFISINTSHTLNNISHTTSWDMNTLRMIGSANLKEGTFHLTIGKERSPSTNNTTTTINNSNL
ncbi:hypothetical protein V8G54_001650 [Vigna mungo]|uniref:Retrotransposon gag domain-containing protein n=1 Tax=Vigna mungo TaxID=3915 RepID=A0AAQ3P8P9_VIGMU